MGQRHEALNTTPVIILPRRDLSVIATVVGGSGSEAPGECGSGSDIFGDNSDNGGLVVSA